MYRTKYKPATLQFYNEYMKERNALCLTQEEFDLLKKTLIK